MAQSRSGKKSTKNSSGKKGTASSRGAGRSSTGRSASARSGAASRSRQPSRRAQRRAETPNLARSILLVGLGLLCVALVLVPGQNLWRTLRSWYFGVFGITTYVVGPFLLYLAYLLATGYRVALFAGKRRQERPRTPAPPRARRRRLRETAARPLRWPAAPQPAPARTAMRRAARPQGSKRR